MSRQLAEILLKDKVITAQQLASVEDAAKGGRGYIRALLDKKILNEPRLLSFLSQKFALPSVNLGKFEIKPEVLRMISPDIARKFCVIPIQASTTTLVVAMCDPTLIPKLEELKFKLRLNVEPVLTAYSIFDQTLAKCYGGVALAQAVADSMKKAVGAEEVGEDSGGLKLVDVHDIDSQHSENDAPIIQLVNGILSEGIRRGASDIHIETYEKRFRVRMRIDGTLIEITEIPLAMRRPVIARVKIMSRMDITENRVPQDGRIKLKTGGTEVDFRVNSMPTLFGEKIVLRQLNKGSLQLDLRKLGFEQEQLDAFKSGIYSPNGMVLVTGPTGSGKTTTLYSGLSELNQISDNISTVEDPVEYNLEGVNQVQINKEVGLTFASVLRALLRQDPDTVLVGEIRDYETAEVAIQAALTGHLVLSTLHTNDAPSTITRLLNMGVEPFMVVSALNTVVAQRLIRRVCAACKTDAGVSPQTLIQYGVSETEAMGAKLIKGKGCPTCNKTGYKGRVAIYEVLTLSTEIKEMVLKGETQIAIKRLAISQGMKTLRQSALSRVVDGSTSLEEAVAMTMES